MQKNPNSQGGFAYYDQQRIREGIAELKEEIKKDFLREYSNSPIFPDAVSNVHPELLDFMLSFSLTLFYNELAKRTGLNEKQRDALPEVVWNVVISKNWNNLRVLLAEKLGVDQANAENVEKMLNDNIIAKAREIAAKPLPAVQKNQAQSVERKIARLPILQAVQKYPKIGEQLITNSPIKLKIFPMPARPSVKNWIADYRQTMGAEFHDTIERGNYLYHSENAKKLSSGERQKLAVILKSVDENEPISIDLDKQEIVFELASFASARISGSAPASVDNRQPSAAAPAPVSANPPQSYSRIISPALNSPLKKQNQRPEDSVRFSFPQKMPVERQFPAPPRSVIRETWSKSDSLPESFQSESRRESVSGENQARSQSESSIPTETAQFQKPAVDSGMVKLSPEAARTWSNQKQDQYKPFRIRPFTLDNDTGELPVRKEGDSGSSVVDLKKNN